MTEDASRYLKWAAVAVLLCVISAFLTIRLMTSSVEVEVPDVTGLAINEAREELKGVGLSLAVDSEEFDPSVPAGHIIKQDIPPGTKTKSRGATFKVVLSKGGKYQNVPNVVGMTFEQANTTFRQKNILIGRQVQVHSGGVLPGVVVAQSPLPEDYRGGVVTLVVSLGPGDVTYSCPDFTGMTKDEVMVIVNALGLEPDIAEPVGGAGNVTSQRPAPGAEIGRGDILNITIGGDNG